MYYIYHIPNIKIGCSKNPRRRVKVQGYDTFEILEQHLDKVVASQREFELQKEYGYKTDLVKYHQGKYSEMGIIAGNLAKKRGHIQKIQKEGSKIASSLPRTEKQLEVINKIRLIGAPIAWGLPRSKKQIQTIKKAQKIGCVEGGKKMGAIMKEKLRVPVAAYKKSDGSFVGNYISQSDCARELGLKVSDIITCLNPKKSQYSTKGYTFKKLQK